MLPQWKMKIVLFVSFLTLMLTILYCSSADTAGLKSIINPVIALYNTSTMGAKFVKVELSAADVSEKAPSPGDSRKEKKLLWLREYPLPPLSQEAVDGVEKFVIFVGYPRSGHSIIGSMMDAHQNIIISHEYMLFVSGHEIQRNLQTGLIFTPNCIMIVTWTLRLVGEALPTTLAAKATHSPSIQLGKEGLSNLK